MIEITHSHWSNIEKIIIDLNNIRLKMKDGSIKKSYFDIEFLVHLVNDGATVKTVEKPNKEIPFDAQELISSLKEHADALEAEAAKVDCTICNKPLKFCESTFEQYEPSTYYCEFCDKDFSVEFIDGFAKGKNESRN